MKAKCPECVNGCDRCKGTGYISVSFIEGDMFTRLCLNPECQFVNGGRICDGFPPESSGPCVICEGETEWVLDTDPKLNNLPDPLPWVKNQDKFYVVRLQKNVEYLRGKIDDLMEFVKSIPGYENLQLTLEQAKLMRVCRICKKSTIDNINPFVFDYGEEYAHKSCLEDTKNGNRT